MFFGTDPPDYDVVWQARPVPARELRRFMREVAGLREALFAEWDAKVKVQEQ